MVGVDSHLYPLAVLLAVVLVVHPEEGGDRNDVAQEEVKTLGQFTESWIVSLERNIFSEIDRDSEFEEGSHHIGDAKQS